MKELDPAPSPPRAAGGGEGAGNAPRPVAPSLGESAAALLEEGPDALVLLDDALRCRWANARGCRALGLGEDALVDRTLWEALPAFAGTPVERAIRAAQRERRMHHVRRIRDARGRWLELHAVPSRSGLAVHLRDVTEVATAEAALRRGERRYRELVEHASDVVLVVAGDGTIRYASPGVTRAIGERPAALEGRRWAEFVHPDDLPALDEAIARALLAPEQPPAVVRARVRDADGGWRIAEAAGQILWPERVGPARPEEGAEPARAEAADGSVCWTDVVDLRPPGRADAEASDVEPIAVVTVRDVTDRAAAEEALRASEARYRGLLEQLGDGIAAIEAGGDGRLVVVNDRLSEMTGYTRAELLGMRVTDIVVDAAEGDVPDRVERLARGEPLLTRRQLRRKDGSLLSTEVNTRQIGTHIQAVVRDVTERELFEEHRRSAQKLEALGLLAGSVAHDFNNFLLAIQSNVELALGAVGGGEAGDAIRTELEDIRRVARRAAGLTRQLLTFSRKQARPPATFPLGQAVTEIEHMLRLLVRPAVALVVRGADGSRCVRADPGQIEQVVMNLVVNARDAMRAGGVVTVTVGSRSLAAPLQLGLTAQRIPPGEWVVLAVSDTGVGIPAETAARVFEPLFTTKAPGAGTGLGLWTVHAVATQSGGYVTLDSTPGVGSTFEVWLPAADEPDADDPEVDAPASALARGAGDLV